MKAFFEEYGFAIIVIIAIAAIIGLIVLFKPQITSSFQSIFNGWTNKATSLVNGLNVANVG